MDTVVCLGPLSNFWISYVYSSGALFFTTRIRCAGGILITLLHSNHSEHEKKTKHHSITPLLLIGYLIYTLPFYTKRILPEPLEYHDLLKYVR